MTRKKERPYNNGTLTEAWFRSLIISSLRRASMYWKPKTECIKNARVRVWIYKCSWCGNVVPASLPPPKGKKKRVKNILADHKREIVPITWFWWYDEWIERCFVEVDGYQALCKSCHDEKTKIENENRKSFEKWEEVWLDIPWYKWYKASTEWRIKWPRKILSPVDNWWWYLKVTLGHSKKEYVHRLVALTFLWELTERLQVCHKDDNPYNNKVDNLFIWTAQDNVRADRN